MLPLRGPLQASVFPRRLGHRVWRLPVRGPALWVARPSQGAESSGHDEKPNIRPTNESPAVQVVTVVPGSELAEDVQSILSHAISTNSSEEETPVAAGPARKGSVDYFGTEELVQELRDPQHFGRRGEAWFFAQLVAIALIIYPPVPLQGLVAFAGTLAMASGVVFLVYALLSLGRNFSPMPHPRKQHRLVTTGMYSYVRHPMYAGLILGALGLAATTISEVRLALACLLWYILEQLAGYEESELGARYPEYKEYKAKVRKFIPFVY